MMKAKLGKFLLGASLALLSPSAATAEGQGMSPQMKSFISDGMKFLQQQAEGVVQFINQQHAKGNINNDAHKMFSNQVGLVRNKINEAGGVTGIIDKIEQGKFKNELQGIRTNVEQLAAEGRKRLEQAKAKKAANSSGASSAR